MNKILLYSGGVILIILFYFFAYNLYFSLAELVGREVIVRSISWGITAKYVFYINSIFFIMLGFLSYRRIRGYIYVIFWLIILIFLFKSLEFFPYKTLWIALISGISYLILYGILKKINHMYRPRK